MEELLDNVVKKNKDRRRPYSFDYGKYDEEQFHGRLRVTKAGFRELLEIIKPGLTAHNDRQKPILIDIQLLLTLRLNAMVSFQMACQDFFDISQASTSHIIIKPVAEAIALLKNNCITIHEGDMLAFSHLIQQRRKNTLTSLQ